MNKTIFFIYRNHPRFLHIRCIKYSTGTAFYYKLKLQNEQLKFSECVHTVLNEKRKKNQETNKELLHREACTAKERCMLKR